MASKIIRIMGESDIVDIDMAAHDGGCLLYTSDAADE